MVEQKEITVHTKTYISYIYALALKMHSSQVFMVQDIFKEKMWTKAAI